MNGPQPLPQGGGTPLKKLQAVAKQMIERFTPTNHTQDIMSYDYREVQGVVPAGITATPHGLQVPNARKLGRLEVWSVVAPGVGESTIIRMFRVRGIGGFSFTLLAPAFTLNAASFPGAGIPLDLTDTIFPNVAFLEGDFIACSWEHSGPQVMQPLNVNWNTSCERPASGPAPTAVPTIWPIP